MLDLIFVALTIAFFLLAILLFLAVVLALTKPLGLFMARVFNGERSLLHAPLRPVERAIYKLTRVDEEREMHWTEYAAAVLLFSLVSMLLLYLIQRMQGVLPLNPQGLPGVDSSASEAGFVGSAFNTAASFTTNTNWQSYVPETTMSYLTQMAGPAYHNFASAAVGIAFVVLAFAALSIVSPAFGTSQLNNAGPHGLSEILYAFTSGAGNNGSAFAGLSANIYWYNTALGIAMLTGRFMMIVPVPAVAGNLARKKAVPPSPGTFPVTTPLFTALLASVVLIVGALTFFPALSLGPIVEHLLMNAGKTF
jgi:K+-transporting ATPase A subunit